MKVFLVNSSGKVLKNASGNFIYKEVTSNDETKIDNNKKEK